jgi:negative regulator of sigma E activity
MPEIPVECSAFEEDLSALIDGQLDARRVTEVRVHVDACEHCATCLRELANVDLVLAGLATPPVADDLHARLRARVAAAGLESPRLQRVRIALPRRPRRGLTLGIAGGIAAAAAVLLALLVGLPRDARLSPARIAHEEAPQPSALPEARRIAPESIAAAHEPEAVVAPVVDPAADPVAERPQPAPDVIAGAREPSTSAPDEPLREVEAGTQLAGLAGLPDEDLALVLELDAVADLDLVANLDLLEALVDLGMADGA